MTSETLSGAPGTRLKHLLAALTELEAPAVAYSRSLKHAADGSTVGRCSQVWGDSCWTAAGGLACKACAAALLPSLICLVISPVAGALLPTPGPPQTLAVEWPGKGGLSLVVRAPLARAEPAQPVIAGMLSLLLDNLTALKQLAEQQQRQLGEFEKQVGN